MIENQKDNSIQSSLDNQTGLSKKRPEPISFFNKDESFVFVYKKTEKLATAMYMITNLFSDNEPIKWSLRKNVSELLSFMVGYKNVLPVGLSDFANEARTRVLEIVSLFEIAYRSGLVSPMNFSILKEEFSILVEAIDSTRTTYPESKTGSFSENFFGTEVPVDILKSKTEQGINSNLIYSNLIKDKPVERNVFNRNSRQNVIINLLKKKKDLTIKDIAQTIKDCSEKTIQRELISLISQNIIKKTGDRRWSRYSLI